MSRRLSRPRRTRASTLRPAEPTDERVRLRARGAPDLLGLIPFKLGFHPQESLVAVFVRRRQVELVARMDLPQPEAAPRYAADLRDLARQHRVDELVLLVYSEQSEPARAFLTDLVAALPSRLVNEALYVDGSRWWSVTCEDSCCPAEGTPYDVASHRLAAEAVFAGLTARPSRADLAASVAGPAADEVPGLTALAADARRAGRGSTAADRAARLVAAVRAALADPGSVDDRACIELAVLVDEIRLRDLVWAMVEPENAEEHVGLWQRVVSRVPPTLSAGPLALVGVAGWIGGHGALLNCAVDELARRHPRYTMGRLLGQISARAIPPRLWQSMGGEVHADLRRELTRLAG